MAEKFKPRILRTWETTAFDAERGFHRAVNVRFEYAPGRYEDLLIPLDEYTPEEAKRRVKKWVEKYAEALGPV